MNAWRDALEPRGVLVFQSNAFALEDARAYSVWFDVLPLVVVHRGDAYAGRSFSLLHEAAHLTLRSDGVCEVTEGGSPGSVEVFCNAVAGAALVPRRLLRKITAGRLGPEWTDEDLAGFAAHFGVSRPFFSGGCTRSGSRARTSSTASTASSSQTSGPGVQEGADQPPSSMS